MVNGTGSTCGVESDTLSAYALEVTSDADLIRIVENLKKQIRILRLENEVLEASIMRLQPSLMTGAFTASEIALKLSQSAMILDATSRSRHALTDSSAHSSLYFKSQSRIFHRRLEPSLKQSSVKLSRSIIGGRGPKINVEERLELVHGVMENQGKDLKKFKSSATKQHAVLEAQLEEIGLRTIDLEKWTLEFEQKVIIEGLQPVTKRIPAEIWIRFMREHGKKIDIQIGKLRLRTSTANIQHRKLREDIKCKKDLASRLEPIDIQIKTINIAEALKIIELKNKHIIGLKKMTGDFNLNVTRLRRALMSKLNYLKKTKMLQILMNSQTVKLDEERTSLEVQVKFFEQRLNWIQEQRKAYLVPDVIDYVKVKLEIRELNNSIKRLQTSLRIKQYSLRCIERNNINLSKILLTKRNLKSTRESTNASDVDEIQFRVSDLNAAKKICSPCGLLPRE